MSIEEKIVRNPTKYLNLKINMNNVYKIRRKKKPSNLNVLVNFNLVRHFSRLRLHKN